MKPDSVSRALAQSDQWICGRCGAALETARVTLSYLGASFPADIPVCPKCRTPFISADLALGKMLQIEQGLEDK